MKKLLFAGCGLLLGAGLPAADDAALKFGGERIGIPPLSLRDEIRKGVSPFGGHQSGARLPAYDESNVPPDRGLALPLTPPRLNLEALKAARAARTPRISREFGMPVLEPSDAVDHTLTIVPPNPAVDFKMIVKDPSPKAPPADAAAK